MAEHLQNLGNRIRGINHLLQFMLEYNPATVTILQPDGVYLYVNRMVPGLDKDKMIGTSVFNYLTPELSREVKEKIQHVSATRNPINYSNEYTGPDGVTRFLQHVMSPVINDDNEMEAVTIISTEITEIRQAQNELEERARILEKKNRQLADFCHIVSHNLRGPLSNLFLINEMLKEEGDGGTEYIQMHETVLANLQKILEDLLQVTQIKTGTDLPAEIIDLQTASERTLQIFKAEIRKTGATVTTDFSAAPTIQYPRNYIDSILLNLIGNALKYRHPDRKPVIRLCSRTEGAAVQLRIADNGLGFDVARHSNRLFKPGGTFHNHPEARGFGLYLVRTQVESMDGSIEVDSEEGTGTTFTVTLCKNCLYEGN